jgi:hypothetical protein
MIMYRDLNLAEFKWWQELCHDSRREGVAQVTACYNAWYCASMTHNYRDQMKTVRQFHIMYVAHHWQVSLSKYPWRLRLVFCLQPKWAGTPQCKWMEVWRCCSTLSSTSDLVPRIPSQQIAAGEGCEVQKRIGNFSEVTLAWELDIQCFTTVCSTFICPKVNV